MGLEAMVLVDIQNNLFNRSIKIKLYLYNFIISLVI